MLELSTLQLTNEELTEAFQDRSRGAMRAAADAQLRKAVNGVADWLEEYLEDAANNLESAALAAAIPKEEEDESATL